MFLFPSSFLNFSAFSLSSLLLSSAFLFASSALSLL